MSLRSYSTCLCLSLSFSLFTYAEWTHKLSLLLFSTRIKLTCKLSFPVIVHWGVGEVQKALNCSPFLWINHTWSIAELCIELLLCTVFSCFVSLVNLWAQMIWYYGSHYEKVCNTRLSNKPSCVQTFRHNLPVWKIILNWVREYRIGFSRDCGYSEKGTF